jgi:hypothetical protein
MMPVSVSHKGPRPCWGVFATKLAFMARRVATDVLATRSREIENLARRPGQRRFELTRPVVLFRYTPLHPLFTATHRPIHTRSKR